MIFKAVIIVFLCSSHGLSASEDKKTDLISTSELLDTWNEYYHEIVKGYVDAYEKNPEEIKCIETTMNNVNNYINDKKGEIATNCNSQAIVNKAFYKKCSAEHLSQVIVKMFEVLEMVLNCIPKAAIIESHLKTIDSYKQNLKNELVKQTRPEKSHCANGVLEKLNDITMKGKEDVARCGAFKRFSPIYCVDEVMIHIFNDYESVRSLSSECINRPTKA